MCVVSVDLYYSDLSIDSNSGSPYGTLPPRPQSGNLSATPHPGGYAPPGAGYN